MKTLGLKCEYNSEVPFPWDHFLIRKLGVEKKRGNSIKGGKNASCGSGSKWGCKGLLLHYQIPLSLVICGKDTQKK